VQHSQQALAKRFAALMKIEVRVCVAHRVVCRVLRIVYCTVLYCTVLYCTVLYCRWCHGHADALARSLVIVV
jgi:hypothetical protein